MKFYPLRKPRKVARLYWVVGLYTDGEERFCDTYRAFTPDEASNMAEHDHPGMVVAGVLIGRGIEVVA